MKDVLEQLNEVFDEAIKVAAHKGPSNNIKKFKGKFRITKINNGRVLLENEWKRLLKRK